ncbi:hypothetical protein ABB05_00515 [Lederbergia galactosidilytica]|uniref:Uncharacterized protein n=1 Tax=Lederbergia galactosidilytica TaxID=217031 RepID=A0A178A9J0_9BACI|nr:hypothetical protein ABB05_00515 [Lederbergia galactosidilytica]
MRLGMGNAHETRTKEADAEIRRSSCSEARTGQLSSRADGNKGLPLVRAGRCQASERHGNQNDFQPFCYSYRIIL